MTDLWDPYEEPYIDPYEDPFGVGFDPAALGLLGGVTAFGGTPLGPDVAYDDTMMGLGYLGDDDLSSAKKRIDLMKALQGLLYDSRTGYGAATEMGFPTFNYGGLTAGEGFEQQGTAEQGNVIYDEMGNPIGTMNMGGGTGGGGTGGGGSRGVDSTAFDSLSNASGQYGRLFQKIQADIASGMPLAQIQLDLMDAPLLQENPDALKMVQDTASQAYQAFQAQDPTKLPKSSDLGTQLAKWGTPDPTLGYTADNLPGDILADIPDYLPRVEDYANEFDKATTGYNRFLEDARDDELFQLPEPQRPARRQRAEGEAPALVMDNAPANSDDGLSFTPTLMDTGTGKGESFEDYVRRTAPARGGPAPTEVPETSRAYVAASTTPSQGLLDNYGITGEQEEEEPVGPNRFFQSILGAAAKQPRVEPGQRSRSGGLLDRTVEMSLDEAQRAGLSTVGSAAQWGRPSRGGRVRVRTNTAGRDAVAGQQNASRIQTQRARSNALMRQLLAGDLQAQGRTPQRDDQRARMAYLRQMTGL